MKPGTVLLEPTPTVNHKPTSVTGMHGSQVHMRSLDPPPRPPFRPPGPRTQSALVLKAAPHVRCGCQCVAPLLAAPEAPRSHSEPLQPPASSQPCSTSAASLGRIGHRAAPQRGPPVAGVEGEMATTIGKPNQVAVLVTLLRLRSHAIAFASQNRSILERGHLPLHRQQGAALLA